MSPIPDRVLLDHVTRRQPGGLKTLYTRYEMSLYALAYGIVRDPAEAEGAVRETFAELPAHQSTGGGQRSVYRWLADRVRSRALGAVRARDWPPRADSSKDVTQRRDS